jgi:hypothetical protein
MREGCFSSVSLRCSEISGRPEFVQERHDGDQLAGRRIDFRARFRILELHSIA